MNSQQMIESCLANCTEPQREAITYMEGPLLVLAGPGSGKTRVITRRIAHLVANGVRPGDILAITFTNKAAGEMRNRVEAMGVPQGAWLSTFHAFCARILRMYGNLVGLTPSFTIYDTSDSLSAIKRAIELLEFDSSVFKPSQVARAISNAKNRLLPAEKMISDPAPETASVGRIFKRYEEILRASNAADFDDLLLLAVQLLRDKPEMREKLGRRFRYVLVDEYQDTNHAQYLIARHMAGHGNLCVTGDPDQSIYGWRGADISNILEFEKDFPKARVVRLEQNYRSTRRILRAADSLITRNLSRKVKELWTENPEGDAVRVIRCEDESQEADAIAGAIAGLVREGRAAPRDVAVFYRLNAQSRALEKSLRDEKLPYKIVAGTEFYQRQEIKDLLAYLRLVDNPADDVSAMRVANTPARKLGATSLSRVRDWGVSQGLALVPALARGESAGLRGPARQGAADFIAVLRTLREMPRSPVAKIVERLIEITKFERHLAAATDNGDERIENARELVNAAAEYDRSEPEGSLLGFLEQSALISDQDAWDEKQGGVTLMTLHAAKGLEFPVVVVTGLEDGLLPLARNGEGVRDLEEERRLFFVGITRARQRVIITYADSRLRYGNREYTQPSRFLAELPDDVEQDQAGPARRPSAFGTSRFSFGRTTRPHTPAAAPAPRTVRRSETEQVVYDSDDFAAEPAVARAPFKAGDVVQHPIYGRGKVLSLSGYGEDARASVSFVSHGVKTLVLKYAKLKKA